MINSCFLLLPFESKKQEALRFVRFRRCCSFLLFFLSVLAILHAHSLISQFLSFVWYVRELANLRLVFASVPLSLKESGQSNLVIITLYTVWHGSTLFPASFLVAVLVVPVLFFFFLAPKNFVLSLSHYHFLMKSWEVKLLPFHRLYK